MWCASAWLTVSYPAYGEKGGGATTSRVRRCTGVRMLNDRVANIILFIAVTLFVLYLVLMVAVALSL